MKKHIVKTQHMVNREGLKLHRQNIRKEENMIMMFTRIIIPILQYKLKMCLTLDIWEVLNDYHTVKSVLSFRRKMNNDLSKEEKIYDKNSLN